MAEWHSLLKRQLKRLLGRVEGFDGEWGAFVRAVDQAYRQFDDDRGMLERSLELSSQELLAANAGLKSLLSELESRVQSRTIELSLANERLRKEVADRVRAEIRLKESEERFRTISAKAKDGIVMLDDRGRVTFWNRAAAVIFGYAEGEVLGRDLHELMVPPADRKGCTNGFGLFMDTGQGPVVGGTLELSARHKDGRIVPVEVSVSAVRIGGLWHAIGIVRDITLRKQSEEALLKAKEEAERTSRLKSDFLSMVSHELRTPLTSVLGFARMIQKRFDEKEFMVALQTPVGLKLSQVRENIGIIVSEGERLTELINNALDLARIEAGHFEWRIEAVDLAEVVDHSLAATGVLFADKGLALTREVEEGLPRVKADRDRLIQVCINLLSNAVKFTRQGSVRCRARLDDGRVVVSVADTGVGIPAEERESVFSKFKQLGDTLTDKPRGTGLGLAICKEIVERQGGRIWVESEPGRGSTFFFSLPAGLSGPAPESLLAE